MRLIYNEKCSKSRKALELLQQRGFEPELIHYLKNPLNEEELLQLRERMHLSSYRQMMRTGDDLYSALELNESSSERDLLEALLNNAALLQRPIFIYGQKAVVARPPENLLEFLD